MVYLRDAADFPAMNQAYAPFFTKDPPTRTTIAVPPADPKAKLEISAVALLPGAERTLLLQPRSGSPVRALRGQVHALNAAAPTQIELSA